MGVIFMPKHLILQMQKMCTCPQSDHALPHWKYVLRCCADCPFINLPHQETTKKHEETTPLIRFHIYHIIGRCTAHGIIPLKDKKIYYIFEQESLPDTSTRIYTVLGRLPKDA